MCPREKKNPTVQRSNRWTVYGLSSQSGVSLLIIIISILVMGVLAAAMYAITSTSYFNQASSQDAMKALYMAEAGPRIVASEYKAAVLAGNENTKMANLNGQTFNPGGSSQFRIDIYPYWVYTPAARSLPGPTSINGIILNLPGGLPLQDKEGTAVITFPASGILKASGVSYAWRFTGATAGATTSTGTPITLNLSTPYPALSSTYSLPINYNLFIGFVQNDAGTDSIFSPLIQTVIQGGNLILNTTGNIAHFFPPENGNFSLVLNNGAIGDYHYDLRDINVLNSGKTTLTNIQRACPALTVCPPYPTMYNVPVISNGTNSLDVAINTQIYVGKTIGIRSTGLSGN